MFNIFKKEISTPNTNEIIAEIHDTFYTEVDRLLEMANEKHSLETGKTELINKAERLAKLGFTSSKEVEEANKENIRLKELQRENLEKESLVRAIEYFSFKYPHYKFITEDSVKKICEKYGLIYGEVQYYKGTVPDINLEHIEKFKITKEDKCYKCISFDTDIVFNNGERTKFINYETYLLPAKDSL